MSDPDPDYPLSAFRNAASSVVSRVVAFVLTCLIAITLGYGLHGNWLNPFDSVLVPIVFMMNIFTGIDLILGVILYLFVCREGSWLYLPIAFLAQGLGAWFAASSK